MSAVTDPAPSCPLCGSAMVMRIGRRGAYAGQRFYGCSEFPRCRGLVRLAARDAVDTGTPGGSALKEYQRRVAKGEERVKARFGHRLGSFLLAVGDDSSQTKAWARGAAGEQELAKALVGLADVRVLHDRGVRGTRGNIDHLVVGPAGVFVVDTKLYRGTIKIRDVGGLFRRDERLYVGTRDCSKLAHNMGWQMEAARAAMNEFDPAIPVTPVLCFVHGNWPLVGAPDAYAGVRIEGTRSIRKLITGSRVLDTQIIDAIARHLAMSLPAKANR